METVKDQFTKLFDKLKQHRGYFLETLELVAVFLLAFLVRILPYQSVFGGKTVNFFAQDPYYHARRIQLALFNNGIIPTYDSYCGYPNGIHCFWSNLYDYSILWTGMVLSGGKPSIWLMETVTAWAPVLWGILSLIPAYLLIREVFDKQTAFLSMILISILPGHIYQTLLGRADHYGADPIFPLFMFYFLIKGIQSSPISKRRNTYWALSGICLTLSWLTWPGSTIFAGILMGFLILFSWYMLLRSENDESCLAVKTGIIMMGMSLVSLFPFCATSYWGRQGLFEYDALSWFQLFFLVLSLGILVLLWMNHKLFISLKIKPYSMIVVDTGLMALIFGLMFLFLPSIFTGFKSGLGWVAKSDPWLKTITEFQPIYINMGVLSWYRPFAFFSYGILLIPLLYLLLFISWYKQSTLTPFRFWFLLYSGCMIFLGINQTRFSHFFALIVATLLAWGLIKSWDLRNHIPLPHIKLVPFRELIFLILWILGIYGLLKPALIEMKSIPSKYAVVPSDWKTTLEWIKENTPPTNYYLKPYRDPEYTILGPWSTGHWINYISRRPTLSNGFHVNKENNLASMEFYLSESLSEARELLLKKKVRYILLSDLSPNLQEYASILGKNNEPYMFKIINHPKGGGTQIGFEPTERYDRLVSTRLYLKDGANISDGNPGCFRLVYETPRTWKLQEYEPSIVKLFEFVKGYEIKGYGNPGEMIQVKVPVRTNTNRHFIYQSSLIIPPSGLYRVYLPYSQDSANSAVYATEPYTLLLSHERRQITVSEKQITKLY